MALLLFAATLFVSAFILFLVQPIIGKLVLPRLGGTPQVWNTCMVFFQMMLLLGYFYTHAVSTKLRARQQLLVHGLLLLSPFLIFLVWPFYSIKDETMWPLPLGGNPIVQTLIMLFCIVGLPFFVVSTTAPLLQKWFGLTGHPAARDPYFLYGASNLGSMLSLILYPALIEPFMKLQPQTILWVVSYGALVALVFVSIAMVWNKSDVAVRPETPHHEPPKPVSGAAASEAIKPAKAPLPGGIRSLAPVHASSEEVTPLRRLRWVALAAVPSSLMLGVTSHITTDLSPVPLFWLVPLALYLLSFILVFSRWPVIWTDNPHTVMVLLQPISIVLLLLFEMAHIGDIWWIISANVIAFFLTTMACHGELAKDRPSTSHLTDFYLMMSVGGVCGGLLNAIIAPLFPWVFEFNLAIIAACLLRPTIPFGNFLDDAIAKMADSTPEPTRGPKARGKAAPVAARIANEPTEQLSYAIDVGVGVAVGVLAFVTIFIWGGASSRTETNWSLLAYGLPLLLAFVFMFRPLRFGLAIAGILVANEVFILSTDHGVVVRTRSYFGSILVRRGAEQMPNGKPPIEFKTLMHGTTDHGRCYKADESPSNDYSRLATTYYTRKCPVGVVMEKFNWFHTEEKTANTFQSDARMPASLVASAAFGSLGVSPLPLGELVEAWSEPPYATIGLGTGTMASYARPFQHCHFYEIDEQIRKLSLPKPGGTVQFTYLQQALDRGAQLQVLMGDARQRMNLPYANYYEAADHKGAEPNGGPLNFYHMMVVDAFSSDAIPAHLLTKEAFEMYFKHLTEDGILCVHTSNRHVNLPLVVADVAESLDLVCKRGHFEPAEKAVMGATSSEWVMVARKPKRGTPARENGGEFAYLKHLAPPADYQEIREKDPRKADPTSPYWSPVHSHDGRYLWTDDYYNLLYVLNIFNRSRD